MIIERQTVGEIQRSENLQETEFRMDFNPEVAMLLSKDLYSNSIEAVVREIGTNAYDAGIEAGNTEVPFEIHLPSHNNLFFAIRDYGPGLAEEDVRGLYSTYFRSTKGKTNALVGGFGIGSKTPFAYSDHFTVTSWHEGIKKTYIASKNEVQMPVIALMHEEPSSEPSGLEVRLAVDTYDVSSFRNAVQSQLQFFPVKPKIYGASLTWQEPEYEFKTERYGILKTHSSATRVVVGVVGYPLDKETLGYKYWEQCPEVYLLNRGIHFFLKVGEVQVALNRESLRFDDGKDAEGNSIENPGKKLIREILAEAVKEFPRMAQEELDKEENLWKARLLRHKLEKQLKDMGYQGESLKLTWKGQKVPTSIPSLPSDNPEIPEEMGEIWELRVTSGKKYGSQVTQFEIAHRILAEPETRYFYINDLEKGSRRRAFYDMKCNDFKRCYLLPEGTPQEFLDYLGVPEEMIITCSDLEEPPRESRGGGGKTYTFLRKWNPEPDNFPYGPRWDQVKVDYKATDGYYVILCRDKATIKVGEFSRELGGKYDENYGFLKRIQEIGIDPERIYGVRPSDLERIQKYSNWRPLGEVILERMEEIKDNYLPIWGLQAAEIKSYRLEGILEAGLRANSEGDFGRLRELFEKRSENPEGSRTFRDISNNFYLYTPVKNEEFLELQDRLFERYPLLKVIDHHLSEEHKDAVAEYIEMMDAKNLVNV